MGSYTVTATHDPGNEWKTKDGKGPFIPHRFEVEGVDGICEWSRKPDSPAPKVGDVLEGTMEDNGSWGKKFRQAKQQGGGGKGWQPPSPEEVAAMRRSGAQNRAVATLDVCQKLGMLEGLANPEGLVKRDTLTATILFLTDFFDGDVNAAAERAKA